jgi:spermidine synthase
MSSPVPARSSGHTPGPALDAAGGRGAILLAYALAFASGAAALVYEVTWAQMLSLTFGSTTLSASAVVAGFMGGMGLGAWMYHLFAARTTRPLVVYAMLELGIAVSAAALTTTFYALPDLFGGLARAMGSGGAYAALRFATVLLLLLVPAILMGATFPALCAVLIRSAPGVDRHLGAIYGVNTIGAAVGVLVAGLFLVERFGLTASVRIANVVNVAVCLGALALLRSPLAGGDRTAPAGPTAIPTALPRFVTGIVLVGSGFCTLGYEILWFRAFRYLMGTSTYAFTVVLFTFLVGLGLGGLLLGRVAQRARPERDLAWCQCAIAVLALGGLAALDFLLDLPAIHERVSIFSNSVRFSAWWWRLLLDAGIAVATMLPATILMGLSFPLATRLFLGDVTKLETRVGTAYLLANLGSIAGAIGGAVVLLPWLGTLGGTKLVAVVNVLLALVIVSRIRRRDVAIATATAGLAVLVLAAALPGAVRFRVERLSDAVEGVVVFAEEGDLATVQVLENPDDARQRAISIDGYKIGWSAGFEGSIFYRKQVLLAHVPMLLDQRIKSTLNVGLGSAATLQALATHPAVERIDCVEINGAVARGSRLFPEATVLEDPRVSLHIDDAVHYLRRTPQTYDLVVSDGKQDPLYAGNAVLLTREFYRAARDRLTDDGLFVQWIPIGTLHEDFRITLRTISEVYEHVDVFFFPPDSILMVGAKRPLAGRPRALASDYAATPGGRSLASYFMPTPNAVLSHWIAGRTQIEQVVGDGPVATWNRMILDVTPFRATLEDWNAAPSANLGLLLDAEKMPADGTGPSCDPPDDSYVTSTRWLRRACRESFRGNEARARTLAEHALKENAGDGSARFFLEVRGLE